MDWNKTKTIFIVIFLLLNVFLGYQLYQRKTENKIEMLEQSSVENRLEALNIKYGKIPDRTEKKSYISGQSELFMESELKKLPNQKIEIIDRTTVVATLDKPVLLPKAGLETVVREFLKEYVLYGKDYLFLEMDEVEKTITCYEKYGDQPIFENKKAMLTLYLNDKNEVTSYEQTYLFITTQGSKKEILRPLKVLERLVEHNKLPYNSRVKEMEFGYYSLPDLTEDVQVLAPTWHVVVEQESDTHKPIENHFYINAIDGDMLNEPVEVE